MITGKVTSIYGKDINTDDIIPYSFLNQSTDRKFFKDYAFDRAMIRPFRERCKQTTVNIVIGGEEFCLGSTAGTAVYAIQENKRGVCHCSVPLSRHFLSQFTQ